MTTCGTTGGYTNHYCRCDACKTAQHVYQVEYRRRPTAQAKRAVQLAAWRTRQRQATT